MPIDPASIIIKPTGPPGHDGPSPHLNRLYCSRNPNPSTICDLCKNDIGKVFAPGTAPSLPRHAGCFCFYTLTTRPPTSPGPPGQDGPGNRSVNR